MNGFYGAGLVTSPRRNLGTHYLRGIQVGGGGIGDTGIMANIPEEVNSIHTEMATLNTEMFNQLPPDLNDPRARFFTTAWNNFFEEWKAYANKVTSVGHQVITGPVGLRETWKELQNYRVRLGRMYEQAGALGYHLTAPVPTAPKPNVFGEAVDTITKPFRDVWHWVRTLVWLGIIAVGGWLLIQGFHLIRG